MQSGKQWRTTPHGPNGVREIALLARGGQRQVLAFGNDRLECGFGARRELPSEAFSGLAPASSPGDAIPRCYARLPDRGAAIG
jgi:hypothetical protein